MNFPRMFGLGLCLTFFSVAVLAANKIDSVRIWPSPDSTRVVFDMQQKPVFRLLPKQGALVTLEIDGIQEPKLGKMSGESELVKSIRVQKVSGKASVRVLLDLSRESAEKAFALPPSDRYGHRLVLDITDVQAEKAFVAPPPASRSRASSSGGRDIIIAIDAGHGGHDPGAVGPKGTYEKHITMAVADKLAALINKEPGFKAVQTRTGDYYIYPSKRPDVARSKQADLLVSIHADAAENRKASGASVWVLSLKRATTEVGRMMEQTEQHSELLGGVAEVIKDSANERYLAQTVLDLSMNHSMTTGFDVAAAVLRELDDVTKLHKKEPQAASLGVLKAPDIPSILVETGYISNHSEEQKLKTASHQQKLAAAIFRALKKHFQNSPPADSAIAQRRGKSNLQLPEQRSTPVRNDTVVSPAVTLPSSSAATKPVRVAGPVLPSGSAGSSRIIVHKVKSGESLSMLARKYGVPMAQLRQLNQLKSDNIRIGQNLKVPQR
jgi:N-acetylmuramoyl-L-alanine amidase